MTTKVSNYNLFGAPAAGKGTQAEQLAIKFNLVHLAPGNLIKAEIATGSDLGKRIKPFYDRGDLIPTPDWLAVYARKITAIPATQGVIFDGAPRNLEQKAVFDAMTVELQRPVQNIEIAISEKESIERQQTRVICEKCGAIYSERLHGIAVCARCGGKLVKRADATPEAIQHRMEVYRTETAPVIEAYRRDGNMTVVNGEQSPESVFQSILVAINGNH